MFKTEVKTTNVAEAMEIGDHNYTVRKEPIRLANGLVIPDKKAVVRTDLDHDNPKRYLGTVGKDYEPVQPIAIYEMAHAMLQSMEGSYISNVLNMHNGSVFGMSLHLARREYLTGDLVDLEFLLLAAHNGMYGILGRALTTRFFCLNQVPSSTKLFNLKHTRFVENRLDTATKMLSYYDREIKSFDHNMKALVNFKMNDDLLQTFVHRMFPEPKGKETKRSNSLRTGKISTLINLLYSGKGVDVPGLKGTGWHAFNALTEYVNHERSTRVKDGRDVAEVRFEAVNFGSGNDLMQRGMGTLIEMAQTEPGAPYMVR